jgi:hypothetical protein
MVRHSSGECAGPATIGADGANDMQPDGLFRSESISEKADDTPGIPESANL